MAAEAPADKATEEVEAQHPEKIQGFRGKNMAL
jgi:hypothetical protein